MFVIKKIDKFSTSESTLKVAPELGPELTKHKKSKLKLQMKLH